MMISLVIGQAGGGTVENVGAQGIPGATPAAPNTNAPATATIQPAGAQPLGGGQPQNPMGGMMIILLPALLLVVMIWFSSRAQKKEAKKRSELIASIGNHDKVQTTGGIIGTVSEIRDDEVVLTVDEQTRTRIRFNKAAIAMVLSRGRGGSNGSTAEIKPGAKTTA